MICDRSANSATTTAKFLRACVFSVNNGQVPTSAQAQGNHTYAISFVPKEAKPHIVELKFNAENVPGSPFKCIIVDAARVNLVWTIFPGSAKKIPTF